jgi:RNA polymerase sigma-70 factor (ECF subfamily)
MDRAANAAVEDLERARERFLAFVRGRVEDPDVAEEIVQQSLLSALESAPRLRSGDALIPWFYAILRNAVIDHYRRRARDLQVLASLPEDLPMDDEARGQLCYCFLPLIDTLKPEYAEVIRELDLHSQSPVAVAKRLGLSATNLKVRRHRARRALRRRLEETCRICAEHHCIDCNCGAD